MKKNRLKNFLVNPILVVFTMVILNGCAQVDHPALKLKSSLTSGLRRFYHSDLPFWAQGDHLYGCARPAISYVDLTKTQDQLGLSPKEAAMWQGLFNQKRASYLKASKFGIVSLELEEQLLQESLTEIRSGVQISCLGTLPKELPLTLLWYRPGFKLTTTLKNRIEDLQLKALPLVIVSPCVVAKELEDWSQTQAELDGVDLIFIGAESFIVNPSQGVYHPRLLLESLIPNNPTTVLCQSFVYTYPHSTYAKEKRCLD